MSAAKRKSGVVHAAGQVASSIQPAPAKDIDHTTIFTIGHSTRPFAEFLALLQAHGVRHLVDVRTIPRSRHNPQFAQDQLGPALEAAGIHYSHAPELGGLRHARRDSANGAWRNASFRGYADYMQTPAFATALDDLIAQGKEQPTAIMCAEAVPWRCHRSLIADALLVHGVRVEEIASTTRVQPHRLTPWAKVDGETITYPPQADPVLEQTDDGHRSGKSGKRAGQAAKRN